MWFNCVKFSMILKNFHLNQPMSAMRVSLLKTLVFSANCSLFIVETYPLKHLAI